jgi:hypothetical protein
LFGRGIGGYIVIRGLAAEEQIAHTSANEQSLMAALSQTVTNRVGELTRRHVSIMLH